MENRKKISILVFLVLSFFMIVVCTISFIKALSWIERPFAGFLIYDCPYIGSMSVKGWSGRAAGLKFLDRVLSVDGQPVRQGRDVVEAVKGKQPGTPVHYVVESKEKTQNLTLPVTLFSMRDFSLTFLINLLGGLAIFCIGFIAYVLKPRVSTSWIFFFFCFFLGLYMVTSFEIMSSYIWVHFHYFALCFMGITLFHLGLIFPEKKQFLNRFPVIEYIIYIPALVLAVFYQIYFFNFTEILSSNVLSWLPSYKSIGTMARIYTLLSVFGMTLIMFHTLYTATSILSRQRARMVLFGVAVGFLPPVVIMMAFYFFKVNFPWNFLVVFGIFFPAFIGYSIVRHNLFDADMIVKQTVGYVLITGIIVGIYALVTVALNVYTGKYQLAQSKAFPILFTLGVILVFNPLRNRIQALVDRLFFRKEYDYGSIVDKISGAMTTLLDLPQIIKHLIQTFTEDMFIDTSSVMLLTSAGTEYRVYLADGEGKQDLQDRVVSRDHSLMEILKKRKRELTKIDLLEDPDLQDVSEAGAEIFDTLRASLMVPLVYQDQLTGFLNLGEKKSGKFYNREDIDLLRTIANQGAVAIENARLFQENLEKQRMEEELSIARDLQMSMLPASCPKVEGIEIAALSTPAMEVGGDFFDFIDMGEESVGFVIGDVTGKSVSGALVMSASRSVFRMLSEIELPVGEIMIRANRRIKKDIKSGMFVALLYAVYGTKDRILRMCSAGQTQPIFVSSKTGEARLLETEGDTFPLGILEEADYQETRIPLEPGDKVIFYTDGIVEAMNEQAEIFGFDRLLETVQRSRSSNADLLLKEIIERVNGFVDNASQHDDLTAIVLSVNE